MSSSFPTLPSIKKRTRPGGNGLSVSLIRFVLDVGVERKSGKIRTRAAAPIRDAAMEAGRRTRKRHGDGTRRKTLTCAC